MRLLAIFASLATVATAVPAIMSEDRITAILEKLKRARAMGELAVNTPTGIYPIKDINRKNLRQIFNFAPIASKDTEGAQHDGKGTQQKSSVQKDIAKNIVTKHHLTTEATKEVISKSTEVSEATTAEATDANKSAEPATPQSSNIATSSEETSKASEEVGTTSGSVRSLSDNNIIEESNDKSGTQSEISDVTNPPTDVPLVAGVEKEVSTVVSADEKEKKDELEGSGDKHELAEGSGGSPIEEASPSTSDTTALLTGNVAENSVPFATSV